MKYFLSDDFLFYFVHSQNKSFRGWKGNFSRKRKLEKKKVLTVVISIFTLVELPILFFGIGWLSRKNDWQAFKQHFMRESAGTVGQLKSNKP
jgi:hypothetical protein